MALPKLPKVHAINSLLVGVGLVLLVLVLAVQKSPLFFAEYAVFVRPDGHYQVRVMRKPSWLGGMPGQAGDNPGVVWLLDGQGQLLEQADVEMVQLVDHVDWQGKNVSIKWVADWDLPD